MEKIKNICCDLGRAFTIGLLSGGAAAAVLLLGGFLFGGFTFRAALEAAKDGLLLIAALGMFVIAGMLMVKGKNPEKFTQKEKWRVHFAVLGYKCVRSSLRFLGAVGGSGGLSFVSDVKIVSINKKRILQTVKMRSGKILFFRLVVIRLRDGR